jgi:hypothetical protein
MGNAANSIIGGSPSILGGVNDSMIKESDSVAPPSNA